MTYPTITALPTAPDPNDPGSFNARAAAWVAALGGFTTQVNAAGSYLQNLAVLAPGGTWQVTATPTDATANRLLKVGDFGLGVTVNAPVLANLDDSTAPSGLYRSLQGTTTGTFPPTSVAGQNGHILYHRNLAGTVWQVYAPAGAAGAGFANMVFTRQFAAGAWGPWTRSYAQNNVLGTVTQDAGVPTGAVIETGSNANGRYTRFADGTQICWRTMAAASGAAATWTFPAAFSAVPAVTGTAVATVLSAVCLDAAPSATAATFSARDSANARRADTCHLRAEGRWF